MVGRRRWWGDGRVHRRQRAPLHTLGRRRELDAIDWQRGLRLRRVPRLHADEPGRWQLEPGRLLQRHALAVHLHRRRATAIAATTVAAPSVAPSLTAAVAAAALTTAANAAAAAAALAAAALTTAA